MYLNIINKIKKLSFKHFFYWMFILSIGFVFIFIIPPFQKSDEIYHFKRASSIANGSVFCRNGGDKQYFEVNKNFFDLYKKLGINESGHSVGGKFLISYIRNYSYEPTEQVEAENHCVAPFGYIPSAIGIKFGFGNPLFSFYFARMANFIFFIFCLKFSLDQTKEKYKPIIYLYSAVPMLLNQVTSVTYDSVQLSLVLLIFCFLTNFIEDKKIDFSKLIIFLSLILFFESIKPVYYLFGFLYFLIPSKKVHKKISSYLLFTLLYFLISFVFLYFVYNNAYSNNGITSYDFLFFVNPSLQTNLVKNDPIFFLKTISNTLVQNDFYYKSFYSFIDTESPFLVYILGVIPFFYVIYNYLNSISFEKNRKNISFSYVQLFILFAIIFGTVFAIFLSFYLFWTWVGWKTISGIQGRYFLALLPFFYLFLYHFFAKFKNKIFLIKTIVIGLFFFLLFQLIVYRPIVKKFYDYSDSISNKNELKNSYMKLLESSIKTELLAINADKEFILDIKDGQKIGGLEFIHDSGINKVLLPYKYEIFDSSCEKLLLSGYLEQHQLQGLGFYEENFHRIISPMNNKICFKIIPVGSLSTSEYLKIMAVDGVPLLNFLYISN